MKNGTGCWLRQFTAPHRTCRTVRNNLIGRVVGVLQLFFISFAFRARLFCTPCRRFPQSLFLFTVFLIPARQKTRLSMFVARCSVFFCRHAFSPPRCRSRRTLRSDGHGRWRRWDIDIIHHPRLNRIRIFLTHEFNHSRVHGVLFHCFSIAKRLSRKPQTRALVHHLARLRARVCDEGTRPRIFSKGEIY